MIFDESLREVKIPPKFLAQLKTVLTKEHGRNFSDEEVLEAAEFMYKMADWAVDLVLEDHRRQQKLKEFPDGYEFDKKGYTCQLCRMGSNGEKMWYDKYGLKCMLCQKAVDAKIIPGRIVGNDDLYYSEHDLHYYFNIDVKAIGRWIKGGLLKARTITRADGKSKHFRLFLISEHKGFLPPKKLLRFGETATETIDGKKWQGTLRWYQCCDPFKYLKKYGIMAYLKIKEEPKNKDL